MKKPIFEIRNLIFNKNNSNILSIKKFEVHRSALYLFNGNMASGKTLLLDILSKNNNKYKGDVLFEGNRLNSLNKYKYQLEVKYVKQIFIYILQIRIIQINFLFCTYHINILKDTVIYISVVK